MSSSHFVLFFALALVETYRDIILANHMDFTDIIKFFNGKCKPTVFNLMDIFRFCFMLIYFYKIIHYKNFMYFMF